MNPLRFLHLADLHKNPKRYADLEASLDVAEDVALREHVAAILLAGDLYDGAEQNSEIELHTPFARRIQRLGNIAPVAIVKGTPTHDIPGSLDILEELACKFGITILQPGLAYFLADMVGRGLRIVSADPAPSLRGPEGVKAILFGLPEPGRSWIASRTNAEGKAKTGDEINAELRALVSGLLLGYGAKRREYPELPCVFMYHGQVRGCRLSNGTTLPDGPVSADDLRQVGADLIAMGDIHEPQQIPGLPAYYPGSVYTDWGEYHKAGCNLVTIEHRDGTKAIDPLFDEPEGFVAKVARIDFPHPQRVKLELKSALPLVADYQGRLAWVEITCTQTEAADLDPEALLADMLQGGALPGSRVSIKPIPTETVRAGEIASKASLAEKITLWGENSATPIPASTLTKAGELEQAVGSLASLAGPERRFRNISTRLRGAKGFWNKQRKDEVFIDWQAQGPGVIAYVGPNGFGKTTSYDFSKPWPVPVSRAPKTLKAHFRLRDSAIENIYLEEVAGLYYRTLINIDGATKSGDAKYFFYRGPSADGPWTRYSEEATSGRVAPFETAIDEVFGSMMIYMRTAFAAQSPSPDYPDIKDATKGEKKDLIAELVGKDLSPYRDYATGKEKVLEGELLTLDATIQAAEGVDEDIRFASEEIDLQRAHERNRTVDAEASQVRGRALKAEHEALSLRVAELDRQASRKAQLESEISGIEASLETIEAEIAGFQAAAGGRAAAAKQLETIATLEGQAVVLTDQRSALEKSDHEALVAYQEETRALGLRRQSAQSDLDGARRALADAEKAEALARAQVDPEAAGKVEAARSALAEAEKATKAANEAAAVASAELERLRKEHAETKALSSLVDELHDGQACPLCGGADHPAPAHADAAKLQHLEGEGKLAALRSTQASATLLEACRSEERARASLRTLETAAQVAQAAQEALAGLSDIIQGAQRAVEAAQTTLDAIQIPPPPEPTPFPGADTLAGLKADLSFLDAAAARETIRQADEADVRIEEAKKNQTEKCKRLTEAIDEKTALAQALDFYAEIRDQLTAKVLELETERTAYTTATNAAAAARASVEAAEKALGLTQERAAKRDEAQASRDTKATELADWRLLERAIDGVRDLELDALAPSIADVATRLLQSSGREGHIEIDTTRIGSGSAKRAKQIEDFLIFHVKDDGERQDIATCSGGEMVWIRKALYDAFAVIRARNGNIKFMTAFLDETDGALFPKDRQDYFRMLEAAHEASGRYQTILTTHSTEIVAMAAQTLDVASLGPREIAREGGIAA